MKLPEELIRHMIDECDYIIEASEGMDIEEFLSDETIKRAFTRSIEVIGEAAKQVPDEYRGSHADIDWRRITGMRDILIHGYHRIDYVILWDAIQSIPDLRERLIGILP